MTAQVRSGGFQGRPANPDAVIKALDDALSLLPLRRVIIGWHPDQAIYQQVARHLAGRDIELYLWLPVFSEVGLLADCQPTIGPSGRSPAAVSLDATENFQFYCPNTPANIDACLEVFTKHFADIGFDGVFLDKIRYPSFANGPDGGLSCLCPRCRATYQQAGIDVEGLIGAIHRLNQLATPFGVTGYTTGRYQFDDPLWQQFFSLRCDIITASLRHIVGYFRAAGYGVGLDVFAPVISQFVGQDIVALSGLADFVKPMMYARTTAPAGLPFEVDALLEHTGSSPGRHRYFQVLGLDVASQPDDLAFCAREVANLRATCGCPVHPGIEINQLAGIADTSPDYVAACLDAYQGADGIVLSWNLLDAPRTHLNAVANSLR